MPLYRSTVDPGHGAYDSGAYDGIDGKGDRIISVEKVYNLNTGMNVKTALMRSGVAVKMTRETDVFIPLQTRCDISNAFGSNAFISCHYNSSDSNARGLEILYYPGSVEGRRLAEMCWQYLTPLTPWADRSVREDTRGLAVLRHTLAPAIIIEYGFLSNTEEEALVATPMYQLLAGEATAHGVCDYLGVRYMPRPTPVPYPGDASDIRQLSASVRMSKMPVAQKALANLAIASVFSDTHIGAYPAPEVQRRLKSAAEAGAKAFNVA